MTDTQLKRLFEQRDRAARALQLIDQRIAAARPDYAKRNGLLAYPSVDAMRRGVGAA